MNKLLLAAALVASCAPAHAQQANVCAKRSVMVAELEKSHGEYRQSAGLARNQAVVEVFANTETGTWSIIVSLPTGMSCLVSAGDAFMLEGGQQKGEAS